MCSEIFSSPQSPSTRKNHHQITVVRITSPRNQVVFNHIFLPPQTHQLTPNSVQLHRHLHHRDSHLRKFPLSLSLFSLFIFPSLSPDAEQQHLLSSAGTSLLLWLVDKVLLVIAQFVIGKTDKYWIKRPKIEPFELKKLQWKTALVDIGAIEKIKSGNIKVVLGIRRFCGLPNLPFPPHIPDYPSKIYFINYLELDATHFRLTPIFNQCVK